MVQQTVQITTEQGQPLGGTLFHADNIAHNSAILICGGTGFLQKYYAPLATWLADKGYTVLTFDYQGIGASRHTPLKQCDVRLQDWGTHDIPAALDFLLGYTGLSQAVLLGHSAGGQMLGVMDNHAQVSKVVAIAGSTGHVANMWPEFARKVKFMFGLYMPLNNALFGYTKLKRIKWGEDLPRHVARQWAQWCNNGFYVQTAIDRGDIKVNYHADITQPITVIHADDDDIANAANVAEFLSLYPHAHKNTFTLNPKEHGFHSIGHNLMFRPSHQALWDIVLREIQLL